MPDEKKPEDRPMMLTDEELAEEIRKRKDAILDEYAHLVAWLSEHRGEADAEEWLEKEARANELYSQLFIIPRIEAGTLAKQEAWKHKARRLEKAKPPSWYRRFWRWILSLVGLCLTGCSGADLPHIPVPGHCGFWEAIQVLGPPQFEEYPDSCIWAKSDSNDTVIEPLGECPGDDSPTCAILFPGDTSLVWGKLSRPGSSVLAMPFSILEDGTCEVSCEPTYGCEPDPDQPTICVPCTEEEPCE